MTDIPSPVVRIRLTGRGGQGIMLAGAILAEACMYDGRQVTETQEYGPEARLGATKAEVILSDREIAFPQVTVPDVLVCLSRDGFVRYGRHIAPGGLRLVERSALSSTEREQGVRHLPWRDLARSLGQELVMNMVALGSLTALSRAVSLDGLTAALRQRVKPDLLALNLLALAAGRQLGLDIQATSSRPAAG